MRLKLPAFPITGGCVCGAVRYRLNAPPKSLYACHCTDCQKLSGGMASMSMPVMAADFEIMQGALAAFEKAADSGRAVGIRFCPTCGTRIMHVPSHSPDMLNLKPGTLDDTSWLAPVAHVWTSSRPAGGVVPEGALAFERQPPSREPLYAAFAAALAKAD